MRPWVHVLWLFPTCVLASNATYDNSALNDRTKRASNGEDADCKQFRYTAYVSLSTQQQLTGECSATIHKISGDKSKVVMSLAGHCAAAMKPHRGYKNKQPDFFHVEKFVDIYADIGPCRKEPNPGAEEDCVKWYFERTRYRVHHVLLPTTTHLTLKPATDRGYLVAHRPDGASYTRKFSAAPVTTTIPPEFDFCGFGATEQGEFVDEPGNEATDEPRDELPGESSSGSDESSEQEPSRERSKDKNTSPNRLQTIRLRYLAEKPHWIKRRVWEKKCAGEDQFCAESRIRASCCSPFARKDMSKTLDGDSGGGAFTADHRLIGYLSESEDGSNGDHQFSAFVSGKKIAEDLCTLFNECLSGHVRNRDNVDGRFNWIEMQLSQNNLPTWKDARQHFDDNPIERLGDSVFVEGW